MKICFAKNELIPQNVEEKKNRQNHKFCLISHDTYVQFTRQNINIDSIKQVRRYRIRIKKFINTYSGKIIKIDQRYGLLSQDSLGLGRPYSTKKIILSSKDIKIYSIISFKAWGRP